ncbi:MAG: ornithine cyclodeaminase family protein [Caldilineaceae bacterium]|nr:ornithine cyclodeaminase family protein [Caldilineaceae bacterium]
MLILARHDVEQLLTMADALTAVEAGFRQLALGNVVMPQRAATVIEPHAGLHLSMPAFVGGDLGALTIKIVTVYGNNPAHHGLPTIQGVLLVHDAQTGQVLALMDAEHLTAMRTGAASGVATQSLARPDAATVTLFGAGALGPGQLAAICAVRPIQRAYVITRTPETMQAFCARMAPTLGIEMIPCLDAASQQAAVEAADILCTATNSQSPLFPGAWIQPGTHINAVGAYTRTMRELDTYTIQRSRVFVDHQAAAGTEAGDLLIPLAEGAIPTTHVVGALGEVLTGQVAGRTDATAITLFKSVGLAMQDAVTAAQLYAKAKEQGMGQTIRL